jgi:uncharacterized membrane protein
MTGWVESPRVRHYLGLSAIVAIALVLRFAQLDLKPLWLDEIITALFSLGRQTGDIPLDGFYGLDRLEELLSLDSSASCPQIARTVAAESTHPPLFFCLTHGWLRVAPWFSDSLRWQLRSLPALFGTGAIAMMYAIARVAFSPSAGLWSAAVMAVSPFAVYLSQEARHYTLPLLLASLSLWGLVRIQRDWGKSGRWRGWIPWAIAHSLGFYAHYFFIIAFAGQDLTLLGIMVWRRRELKRRDGIAFGLANAAVLGAIAPWLPTLLGHVNRPETDWFEPFNPTWVDSFAPIYQTLASWLVMAVTLPVERQPLWIAIPSGLLMVAFFLWLVRDTAMGIRQLWQNGQHRNEIATIGGFTLVVVAEFFAIAYLLGKDITTAPRYHFIYYPGICLLLGASLARHRPLLSRIGGTTILAGLLGSILVINNWAFHKPYYPEVVANELTFERSRPTAILVGYRDLQEIALGLSFLLEVETRQPDAQFGFFRRVPHYRPIWQTLSQPQPLPDPPLNLWAIAPGLKQVAYPEQFSLAIGTRQTTCQLDPNHYRRLGIPYQLYRCRSPHADK